MKQNLYSNIHNALLPAKFTYPVRAIPRDEITNSVREPRLDSAEFVPSIFRQKKKKKKVKGKSQPHRVDGTNDVIVPKPAIRVRILRRVVDRIQPVESNPRGGVSISFSSRKIAWLASLPAAHERGMEKNGGKCTANEERKRDVRP